MERKELQMTGYRFVSRDLSASESVATERNLDSVEERRFEVQPNFGPPKPLVRDITLQEIETVPNLPRPPKRPPIRQSPVTHTVPTPSISKKGRSE